MSDDFFAEFDVMFAELARRSRPGEFAPNADVFMTPDGTTIQVEVEIAGTEPGDLGVMVEARGVYIIGRRIYREGARRGSVLQKEITYGDFARKLHLPVAVSFDDATASYRDGILTIRLPISEHSDLPTRRTEIRMTVKRILA